MRISIITVTYNAGHTILRTLQSVACQTHPDIEHLIIDGASKDNTIDIVCSQGYTTLPSTSDSEKTKGLSSKTKCYTPDANSRGTGSENTLRHFISEPDKGLYDAMNKGLHLATGDFLCFLNAGDTLSSPDTLAHIAAKASEPKAALIYGETNIVDDNGQFLRPRRLHPTSSMTWRNFKHGMLICHQAFYIRRDLAPDYDLSYRFSADFDWCIRCMKEAERKGMLNIHLPEPIANYLSEGMTTANHKASLRERYAIMVKHYGSLTTAAMHLWFVLRAIVKA